MKRKLLRAAALLLSLAAAGFLIHLLSPEYGRIYGQYNPQVAVPPGFTPAVNYLAPTTAQLSASGGVVTNPASNSVIQVSPGIVFCNGETQQIGSVQLTLVLGTAAANNTYLVVYNCLSSTLYAHSPTVGPGSAPGTLTLPSGQPGVVNTILQAVYPEIGLATVVCNATACGNGGNGSITNAQVPNQWGATMPVAGHLVTPAANSSAAPSQDVAGTCVLGTSCAITFKIPWQNAPVCQATDETTAATTAPKAIATTTTLTITGNGTDTMGWFCVGNPN